MPTATRTLLDKLWDPHVVHAEPDGRTLLFIDRHLFHDGSFQAFARLREKGLPVIHPELALATPDHYAPTDSRSIETVKDPAARRVLGELEGNTRDFRLRLLPMGDGRSNSYSIAFPSTPAGA